MIYLRAHRRTVIHVATQVEYEKLMDIYEESGWVWSGGQKPKGNNKWGMTSKLCIGYKNQFKYCGRDYYKKHMFKVISFDDFLESRLSEAALLWSDYNEPIDFTTPCNLWEAI